MSYHVGSSYVMMSRHVELSLGTSRPLPEGVRRSRKVVSHAFSFIILIYVIKILPVGGTSRTQRWLQLGNGLHSDDD